MAKVETLEPCSARAAVVCGHLGVPLGNGLSPLVLFYFPGRSYRPVRIHCAAAFDFQFTYVVAVLITTLVVFVTAQPQPTVAGLYAVVAVIGGNTFLLFFGIRAAVDGWQECCRGTHRACACFDVKWPSQLDPAGV